MTIKAHSIADLFDLTPYTDARRAAEAERIRRRTASHKQASVLIYLENHNTMILAEAVEIIGRDVYANKEKHVGQVLSRMVAAGMIERIKPGLFQSITL